MGEATEVHLVASLQFYLVELLLFWIVYILTLQGTLVMRQMVNLLATSVDTRHEDYSLHCCPPPPPPAPLQSLVAQGLIRFACITLLLGDCCF